MPHKSSSCGNFLVQELVRARNYHEAFKTFQEIQENGVCPDRYTFQALLKACARLKCIERGRQVYTQIISMGHDCDAFVGSGVIDMYAKAGYLVEARKVFDKLPARDVVSWTALIAGYAEHKFNKEALNCLEQMELQSLSPNSITFSCGLKACGNSGMLDKGQEIHSKIAGEGFENETCIGSALIDMYAKCGSLLEAQEVFDELPMQDIVSWTALIVSYSEHGYGQQALKCFEKMQLGGFSPDVVTFLCSLKACCTLRMLTTGQQLHAEVVKGGLEIDPSLSNTVVDLYAKCGLFLEARKLLDQLPARDVVSWNTLISGYVEHGNFEEAVFCLEQMQLEGVSPSPITYVCTVKACGNSFALEKGQKLHTQIVKKGLEGNVFVGSTLVDLFAKCGLLFDAQAMFDKLHGFNVIAWTALISGYADHGLSEYALHCFEQLQAEVLSMNNLTLASSLKACGSIKARLKGQQLHENIVMGGLERDTCVGNALVEMYAACGMFVEALTVFEKLQVKSADSWKALLVGYVEHGFCEEALEWLDIMEQEGQIQDVVSYAYTLRACTSVGAVGKGQTIHAEITKEDHAKDLFIGNALLDMYMKCGFVSEALDIFCELEDPSVVSWTALITGYACQGESKHGFGWFRMMTNEAVEPDGVTFLSLLTLCSQGGLVDSGFKVFEVLTKEFHLTLSIEHLNSMIDIVSRAGQFDMALAIICMMPFEPNGTTWNTILGACRKWCNVKLGERAFDQAVRLGEKDAGTYLLMSNIYAEASMWDDMRKIDSMRTSLKVQE